MSKKKEKVNEISTTDEGTKLVKIIVIILILFAIFYFLTGYVSKYMNKRNNKVNTTPETAVIQYDKIMIGEILNQSSDEYYVLLNYEDDYYQELYDSYNPSDDEISSFQKQFKSFHKKNSQAYTSDWWMRYYQKRRRLLMCMLLELMA